MTSKYFFDMSRKFRNFAELNLYNMENLNIRQASPKESAENIHKQTIMAKYGINVKVDGSWGPWQQEQWEKLQYELNLKHANTYNRAKNIELCLGIFLLIPAILGVLSFLLCFFDFHGDFADLRNLRGDWTDGDYNASPAPLFMGLTAIAGVVLIIDFMKYKKNRYK